MEYRINLDQVLEDVGPFGAFQKTFYFLLCLPCTLTAFVTLASVFTAAIPPHRCFIPSCDTPNSTYKQAFDPGDPFATFSIPSGNQSGGFNSCQMYKVAPGTKEVCQADHFDLVETETCSRWVFDRSVYNSTLATDFDLVCDEAWQVPLGQSVYFGGVLVGALTFGILADYLGRKPCLMFAILLSVVSSIASGLAPNYPVYLAMNFLVAFGQLGLFQTAFILSVENVGKDYRVFCSIIIEYFFVLGEILLTLVAYFVRDWRYVILYVMVPAVGFVFYWPILPESVRWLLTQRKYDKAQREVNRICRWNKTQFIGLDDYKEQVAENSLPNEGVLELLKSKVLVSRSINVCYCWFVVSMTFYGLSMNATSLAGDPFLNFLLVSLAEIPGYTLSYLSMERLGRRKSISISLLIGGVACIIGPFVPTDMEWLTIALFLLGKMGVTCAFGTVYLFTSELYPTTLRTLGVGFSSMFGRIGAIISPEVASLSLTAFWLPMVIFGGNAVFSGVIINFLPETLGKELPDTIEDSLTLGQRVTRVGENTHVDEALDDDHSDGDEGDDDDQAPLLV
ncbi:organic cation transporter protein-like [Tigriopus californicus]|uniref:organic cation transporter protein-like n=1 Tax=Tigriopus californicus TaxID=6832 RepID=UPI0027DA9379|nr:organic cation transporter protein-like [Tigriopus californicus]